MGDLIDNFVVLAYTGELEYEVLGVWDTYKKARSIAIMHWHDTGQLTDVLKMVRPLPEDM